MAVLGDLVYFLTPDCNLVALDIKTGQEKWFKEVCSLEMMYFGSVAPVVIKDKLIFGAERRRPGPARVSRRARSRRPAT